jgi:hypothetical protein
MNYHPFSKVMGVTKQAEFDKVIKKLGWFEKGGYLRNE